MGFFISLNQPNDQGIGYLVSLSVLAKTVSMTLLIARFFKNHFYNNEFLFNSKYNFITIEYFLCFLLLIVNNRVWISDQRTTTNIHDLFGHVSSSFFCFCFFGFFVHYVSPGWFCGISHVILFIFFKQFPPLLLIIFFQLFEWEDLVDSKNKN